MNYHKTNPPDRFLSVREVMSLTTLSRATLGRKAGLTMPAFIKLTAGGSRVGMSAAELQLWMSDPLGWAEQVRASE